MLTPLLAQFAAVLQDTTSGAACGLLENLQRTLEYCVEENAVLREVLEQLNPGKRIRLSNEQKRRHAQNGVGRQ